MASLDHPQVPVLLQTCSDPTTHMKKGRCSECTRCNKSPPRDGCSGATHIGTRQDRIATKDKVSKRSKRRRSAKRSATQAIAQQVQQHAGPQFLEETAPGVEVQSDDVEVQNDDVDDVEDVEGITVPKLMNMFIDKKKIHLKIPTEPMMMEEGNDGLLRWGALIEKMLETIFDVCVNGNPHALMVEVLRRLTKAVEGGRFTQPDVITNKNTVDTVVRCAVKGSASTREYALSILSQNWTREKLNDELGRRDYNGERQKKANENKDKRAAKRAKRRRKESDTQADADPEPIMLARSVQKWSVSRKNFSRLRTLGKTFLNGEDPPKITPKTTIKPAVLLSCVEWITGTFQYRPGILRNYRINGFVIKNLPVFIRVGPIQRIFASYKATMTAKVQQSIGRDLFFVVLKALTEPSGANAALSYYYVSHIDLVAELRDMMTSISDRVTEPTDALTAALKNLQVTLTVATDYLRYTFQHELATSNVDGWLCATLAVGGTCNHNHTLDNRSTLSKVLNIRTTISDIATAARNMLNDDGDSAVKVDEIESIERIALLTEREFYHYAKHLVRDWWQSKHIKDAKMSLGPNEGLLYMDHKQKILPKRQNEAQSDYFGKAGMSLCGAMLVTKQGADEKFSHLFFDVVMKNVNTQRAEDLLPVLDSVLREIRSSTNVTHVILLSDNAGAFASYGHIPFLHARNQDENYCSVSRWIFNEPQCGKSMLDTHFAFVNIQLKRALLDMVPYTNQLELHRALSHDGGIRGTVVLLVSEFDNASKVAKSCVKLVKNEKPNLGIRSAHEFNFTVRDRITLHHQAGLPPTDTINPVTSNWPKEFPLTGTVEEKSQSADVRPLTIKMKNVDNDADSNLTIAAPNDNVPANNTTRSFAHALLRSVEQHLPNMGTRTVVPLPMASPDETVTYDVVTSNEFIKPHWAIKQNKNWIQQDESVRQSLQEMFDQGVGSTNKKTRVSAEVATRELKDGPLKHNWDQRFMCSLTKVKQVYSQLNQKQKKRTETAMTTQAAANDGAAAAHSDPILPVASVPVQAVAAPSVDPPPPQSGVSESIQTVPVSTNEDSDVISGEVTPDGNFDGEADHFVEDMAMDVEEHIDTMVTDLQMSEYADDIVDICPVLE